MPRPSTGRPIPTAQPMGDVSASHEKEAYFKMLRRIRMPRWKSSGIWETGSMKPRKAKVLALDRADQRLAFARESGRTQRIKDRNGIRVTVRLTRQTWPTWWASRQKPPSGSWRASRRIDLVTGTPRRLVIRDLPKLKPSLPRNFCHDRFGIFQKHDNSHSFVDAAISYGAEAQHSIATNVDPGSTALSGRRVQQEWREANTHSYTDTDRRAGKAANDHVHRGNADDAGRHGVIGPGQNSRH